MRKVLLLAPCLLSLAFSNALSKPLSNVRATGDKETIAQKSSSVLGWTLTQNSKFFGKTEIFVSSQGVRLSRSRDDLVIVATPPEWTVISYKPSSKKICKTSLQNFGYLTESFLKPINLPPLVSLPGSEKSMWQTKTRTYSSNPIPFTVDVSHKNVGRNQTFKVFLVAATDLKLPEQVGFFMSKYYGIPIVKGVPLQFRYSQSVEGSQLDLATELLKPEESTTAKFKIPSDYKEVKDIREVNIDSESSKFIDDFAKNLGK